MKKFTVGLKKHGRLGLASVFSTMMMISGVMAQEDITVEELEASKRTELLKTNATPDKSSPIMLNVAGGDARINGLTVGRGGGMNENNTAFGFNALLNNGPVSFNTAIGNGALRNNTFGSDNTGIGNEALTGNTTGFFNTAIGSMALYYNQTGYSNIAVGRASLFSNNSGYSNIAIGGGALSRNTDRSNLVAIGDNALFNNGQGASGTDHATANTALGSKALYANTIGYFNTAVGFESLTNNISGYRNTATGYYALSSNTTGYHNTATGDFALRNNTGGSGNTAIGFAALQSYISNYDNTAIGFSAGYVNPTTRGTFVGSLAYANASGYSNVTGIGYNVRSTASNQVRIGNTSVTSIGGNANWTNFSDGDFKSNVSEEVAGLDFILRLRPVSYNLDVHKLATDLGEDETHDEEGNKSMATPDEISLKSRDEKSAIRFTGFIAQEVEATVNELGVAFSGVDAPVNKSSYYGLRYADFVVPLVKAVQEQQAQIELLEPAVVEALQIELQEVQGKYMLLDEKNRQLEEKNAKLENKVDQILTLLNLQGLEPGSGISNDPSRAGSDRSNRNTGGNVRLEQNVPNPFHENTVIRYYLPENSGKAQLIITDLLGNRMQTNNITGIGPGELTIHGGALSPGTYVYSLIIDGQLVDSKRMVLL